MKEILPKPLRKDGGYGGKGEKKLGVDYPTPN